MVGLPERRRVLGRAAKRGFISSSESPPSFSMSASARTVHTAASTTTTARGTGHTSLRSYVVSQGAPVARSTVACGRSVVGMGFIAARMVTVSPLEMPPVTPPASRSSLNPPPISTPFMAGMEMIHTHSLIHDDLPAMDNDEYRRGMKTTHIMYGEAIAILAGDALLSSGYAAAASAFSMSGSLEDTRGDREKRAVCCGAETGLRIARALRILALKSGMDGMIGGQSCDVEYDGRALSEGQLDFIYRYKTGALIEASLMIGAILAGAPEEDIRRLEQIALYTGLAFQIQDDILDVIGDSAELGKPVGSDEEEGKTTYVTLYGLDQASRRVQELSSRALEEFDKLSVRDGFLRELILRLVSRRK